MNQVQPWFDIVIQHFRDSSFGANGAYSFPVHTLGLSRVF